MKHKLTIMIFLLLVAGLLIACSTPSTAPENTGNQNDHSKVKVISVEPDVAVLNEDMDSNAGKGSGKTQLANSESRTNSKEQLRLKANAAKDANISESRVAEGEMRDESQKLQAISSQVSPRLQLKPTAKIEEKQKIHRRTFAAKAMQAPVGTAITVPPVVRWPTEPLDRENYAEFKENSVVRVAENPVSTFSIDVDTGSYTNTRRILNEGRLPAKNAVRVEEFVNYFNYDYPAPESSATPFNVITEIGPSPWNPKNYLLHIGLKGYEVPVTNLPPASLVFLVDVSGSMQSANKLPLLKKSLQMLTQKLRAEDKISLVVYAGASGTVLEPTSGANKATILSALEGLSAGGSTNGAAGIRLAYLKAQQAFVPNGINRVILATDGDFNVGTTNFEALKDMVEKKRKTGIYLTTLGFGAGNYNDKLMEQIADAGNGNYAYIDSLMEAQKVLVSEMGSTLQTIAKDVKIQIEFNPATVSEYRLVGYENRALRREDFNNDKIDAGEIGAGHTVTAIYEVSLVEKGGSLMDPLRYQSKSIKRDKQTGVRNELAFLRLRYKQPESSKSVLTETPVLRSQIAAELKNTSKRFKFSASVAGFAQLLRGGNFTNHYSYADVVSMAHASKGSDRYGYRSEFVRLVELANNLSGHARAPNINFAFK